MREEIFREYDIRGVVGRDLTKDVARDIGRGFGTFLKGVNPSAKAVSVGRDIRLHSKELAEGLTSGLRSVGLDVCDIGECPTPLQYFSLFRLDLDGGIMVTGSHNPPEYNGFKLSAGKETIYGEQIQKIRETIKEQPTAGEVQGSLSRFDVKRAYTEYVLHEFSYLKDSWYRRLRIVVDAGNGTAGMIVPDILSALGCEVIPLYCEPDGRFPNHHPDPTVVANMQDLIAETIKSKADFGVAYDGDADRIGVVDREGTIIWGDQLVIVLSRQLLAEHPGAKVIGDVKCSQVMFDDIQKHGGVPIMWKTGHSLVKQKMREEGALLAGEFSGHIFIADRYFGYDDAIYTTLRLVEIMKRTGKDIHELLSDVPKTLSTPEIRMDCPEDKKKKIVDEVIKRLLHFKENDDGHYPIEEVSTIDGIRVVFEKGWALVRMSNTQPVIVMRFEADNEERLRGYQEFVRTVVRNVEESL